MTRSVIDAFLSGQLKAEKAFLPAVEALAARIGSMDFSNMMAEPGNWSTCLSKTGQLLGLGGLILGLDQRLAAEAYGAQICWDDNLPSVSMVDKANFSTPSSNGHLGCAIEAMHRLLQTEQSRFACVAGISGPVALAALLGDAEGSRLAELKQSLVGLAEGFCRLRPDLLLFREGAPLGLNPVNMQQRKAYNTLKNMAAYFNVPVAIYLEHYDSALLPELAKLKVPFILLGADKEGGMPDIGAVRELAGPLTGIGVPLSFDDPQTALAQVDRYQNGLAGINYLYTGMQELHREIDLERLRSLISDLSH